MSPRPARSRSPLHLSAASLAALLSLSVGCDDSIKAGQEPTLSLSESAIVFVSPSEPGGSTEVSITLSNNGGTTLLITEVTLTENDESPEVALLDADDWQGEPVSIEGGASRTLTLRWTPTNPLPDTGALSLTTNAGVFVVPFETSDLDPLLWVLNEAGERLPDTGARLTFEGTRPYEGAFQRLSLLSAGFAPLSIERLCFINTEGECLPEGEPAQGRLKVCSSVSIPETMTSMEATPSCAPLGAFEPLLNGADQNITLLYVPQEGDSNTLVARLMIESDSATSPRMLINVTATPCEGEACDLPMGGEPMGGEPMGGEPMGGEPMGGEPMGGEPAPVDADMDGYPAGEQDCDDNNPERYQGAPEIPNDGVDQDCDGQDLVTEINYDTLFVEPGRFEVSLPDDQDQVLSVRLWGAGGAAGNQLNASGGGGAYVSFSVPVPAGAEVVLWVGEGGQDQGDGGGASAVFLREGEELRLIGIAAGGGGGASDGNSGRSWSAGAGGPGGWSFGIPGQDLGVHQNGTTYSYCELASGGQGGTWQYGGAGGDFLGTANGCPGAEGQQYVGGSVTSRPSGDGVTCTTNVATEGWRLNESQGNGGGGAGGSGYFGGGSGGFVWTYCGGGGGGGSSWVSPETLNVTHEEGAGAQGGNPTLSGGAGRGGERPNPELSPSERRFEGSHGRVELAW